MINEELQARIDDAQAHRRKARKLLADGNQEGAAASFDKALEAIRAGLGILDKEESPNSDDPTEQDRELATLFADLRGIEGGTYRDMVPLDLENANRAITAYDDGADYERAFSLKSTYNFVNQLVLRFLRTPDLLDDFSKALTLEGRQGGRTESVAHWLRSADRHVEGGLAKRDDPAWALADLVLLAALQSSSELSARLARFETQVQRDSDTYPYVSLDRVVRDLVQQTSSASPAKASLQQLAEWIGSRLQTRQ